MPVDCWIMAAHEILEVHRCSMGEAAAICSRSMISFLSSTATDFITVTQVRVERMGGSWLTTTQNKTCNYSEKKRKYPKIPQKCTKNHLLHIPDVLQVGFINGTTWKAVLQHPLPWSDSRRISMAQRCAIPKIPNNLVSFISRITSKGQIWGFHTWKYPKNGWFMKENPSKIDELGIPPCQETTIWESTLPAAWHDLRRLK